MPAAKSRLRACRSGIASTYRLTLLAAENRMVAKRPRGASSYSSRRKIRHSHVNLGKHLREQQPRRRRTPPYPIKLLNDWAFTSRQYTHSVAFKTKRYEGKWIMNDETKVWVCAVDSAIIFYILRIWPTGLNDVCISTHIAPDRYHNYLQTGTWR